MSHFRILILSAQAILYLAHALLFLVAVRSFRITRPGQRLALGAVLLFVSSSYLLGGYLAHVSDNAFTRALYFFGGFWLGLSFHLMAAAAVAWLLLLAARGAGLRPRPAAVVGALFIAALAWSAYGVWNAFNPVVTGVSVTVKGLPPEWKGAKIAHISDVHLGHIYRAGYMERLVRMVNGAHPDMVVITGDLFDGMDGDIAGLAGPLRGLHAPRGVYFVTGNHERHLGLERVFSVMSSTGVTTLNDRVVNLDGLQLLGMGYRGHDDTSSPVDAMERLPGYVPGLPTVLLYHSPAIAEEAAAAGVALQLSGHTHKGQIFPFGYITRRIYDGLDYGLHETGDYRIYTSNGAGTWGPPMRTGNRPEVAVITLN